jgi:hypothetical protein
MEIPRIVAKKIEENAKIKNRKGCLRENIYALDSYLKLFTKKAAANSAAFFVKHYSFNFS